MALFPTVRHTAESQVAYVPGMSENKPGHKPFKEYSLPEWTRHPLKAQPKKVALLFPGEQNQTPGILQSVATKPEIQDLLLRASTVFGWDVADLMSKGPKEKMYEKCNSPCLTYVANCIVYHVLKERKPALCALPQAVAGFSIGELSALYVAGVITYDQGLELVRTLAEAIQDLEDDEPMEAVFIDGHPLDKIEKLCKKAEKLDHENDAQVGIARIQWPNCYVCAGKRSTVLRLQEVLGQDVEQAKEVRLLDNHFHAGHTAMARTVGERLSEELDKLYPLMQPPRCDLYLNHSGLRVPAHTSPDLFLQSLKLHMTSPVNWLNTVVQMLHWGVLHFYECGPGKSLKMMMEHYEYVTESPYEIRHPANFTLNVTF